MRQSKRELHRRIEELDDEHHEGPDRIEITETVVGTEWGDEDDAGDVVEEETWVVNL